MGLNIIVDEDNTLDRRYLDRRYNVEYSLGNGKINTFSNVLRNADNKYFWFSSIEDGIDVIQQDRIVTMVCIERR